MTIKDKQPLTFTVGDTAFGERLRDLAETQAQNPRESRDKNSGGRHRSPRKGRPMGHQAPQSPETPTPDVGGKKDIAPAGGSSKSKKFLSSSVEVGGELVHDGARGMAWGLGVGLGGGVGLGLAYCGMRAVGLPIP